MPETDISRTKLSSMEVTYELIHDHTTIDFHSNEVRIWGGGVNIEFTFQKFVQFVKSLRQVSYRGTPIYFDGYKVEYLHNAPENGAAVFRIADPDAVLDDADIRLSLETVERALAEIIAVAG